MASYAKSTKDAGAARGASSSGGAVGGVGSTRDLVENCINNDDLAPLARLVFEAQAIPDDPATMLGAGHDKA